MKLFEHPDFEQAGARGHIQSCHPVLSVTSEVTTEQYRIADMASLEQTR